MRSAWPLYFLPVVATGIIMPPIIQLENGKPFSSPTFSSTVTFNRKLGPVDFFSMVSMISICYS